MCGPTLTDESLSLAVVEVVVRENQIEATGHQCASSCCETWNNRDTMRSQELLGDLLCKDCVVFEEENVHDARSGIDPSSAQG